MFMDTYVERFREGMDDEFQLDVMYRAHVIFAGVVAVFLLRPGRE